MTEDNGRRFCVHLLMAMERQLGALKHLHLILPSALGLGPQILAIESHLAEARRCLDAMNPLAADQGPEKAEPRTADGSSG